MRETEAEGKRLRIRNKRAEINGVWGDGGKEEKLREDSITSQLSSENLKKN